MESILVFIHNILIKILKSTLYLLNRIKCQSQAYSKWGKVISGGYFNDDPQTHNPIIFFSIGDPSISYKKYMFRIFHLKLLED